MATTTVETVPVNHCGFEGKVTVGGDGPPVVYFHTAGGPRWDGFLDGLAEQHTVYAPDHPGLGATARESIYGVGDLWDLVLIYDELLDELGLGDVPLIGSSFGGMVACELAALRRARVPEARAARPDRAVARRRTDRRLHDDVAARPDDDAVRGHGGAAGPGVPRPCPRIPTRSRLRSRTPSGRWGRPASSSGRSPTRGLKKRIHRVAAETLIIWGDQDRLVSPVYAQEFAGLIPGSRVEIIEGAGHVPQWEQLDTVKPMVLEFLGA